MGYTTADLSHHISTQIDLAKLTADQIDALVEADSVFARHSLFDTDIRMRCQNCLRDNRCSDLDSAVATYERFQVIPKRLRRTDAQSKLLAKGRSAPGAQT